MVGILRAYRHDNFAVKFTVGHYARRHDSAEADGLTGQMMLSRPSSHNSCPQFNSLAKAKYNYYRMFSAYRGKALNIDHIY